MENFKWLLSGTALISLLFSHTALALSPPAPSERLPFIRLYNPAINDHFYTSSRVEADTAVAMHGYRIEGEMGYVERYQQDGTEPIIRMWNPVAKKHFYTTNQNEATTAQASGFIREGSIGFMLAYDPIVELNPPSFWQGRVIVYRMYNPSQRKHFYTTDRSERELLQTRGYNWEGQLGGWIYNSSADPSLQ